MFEVRELSIPRERIGLDILLSFEPLRVEHDFCVEEEGGKLPRSVALHPHLLRRLAPGGVPFGGESLSEV